jgi:hypothetical protein
MARVSRRTVATSWRPSTTATRPHASYPRSRLLPVARRRFRRSLHASRAGAPPASASASTPATALTTTTPVVAGSTLTSPRLRSWRRRGRWPPPPVASLAWRTPPRAAACPAPPAGRAPPQSFVHRIEVAGRGPVRGGRGQPGELAAQRAGQPEAPLLVKMNGGRPPTLSVSWWHRAPGSFCASSCPRATRRRTDARRRGRGGGAPIWRLGACEARRRGRSPRAARR